MNTQMRKYRATRDFGVPGSTIQRGMTIEFDDYNIVVAGRPPQALPTFKGAISLGWAVPEESYDPAAPTARPVSANIRVRPADTGNPNNRQASSLIATADAEEQIVGNVSTHAAGVRQANQSRSTFRAAEVEPQDGVTVRTLKTVANARWDAQGARTTLTGSNTQQAIAEAEKAAKITPGRGMTRDELLERLDPDQRSTYEAEILAKKSAYVDLPAQDFVQRGPETQGRVVATIDAPEDVESMGIRTVNTVGGGTETVDLSGLDGAPAEQAVIESEGLRFRTTNGPRKVGTVKAPAAPPAESLQDIDPRRVIARSVCRDFPDLYDFDLPLRKKIARLQADFEDRPDVIRAVAAAETDSEMRLLLVNEFPEAFQAAAP